MIDTGSSFFTRIARALWSWDSISPWLYTPVSGSVIAISSYFFSVESISMEFSWISCTMNTKR